MIDNGTERVSHCQNVFFGEINNAFCPLWVAALKETSFEDPELSLDPCLHSTRSILRYPYPCLRQPISLTHRQMDRGVDRFPLYSTENCLLWTTVLCSPLDIINKAWHERRWPYIAFGLLNGSPWASNPRFSLPHQISFFHIYCFDTCTYQSTHNIWSCIFEFSSPSVL